MDNSAASTSKDSPSSNTDIFAYQKQLLDRRNSLSRVNSKSGGASSAVNQSQANAIGASKWISGHRTSQSIDAVRSKWEERARESSPERFVPISPTKIAHTPLDVSPAPLSSRLPPLSPFTTRATIESVTQRDSSDLGYTSKSTADMLLRRNTSPLSAVGNVDGSDVPPSSPLRRVESMRSKWERTSDKKMHQAEVPSVTPPLRSSAMTTDHASTIRSDSSSSSLLTRQSSIRSKWEERERELAAFEHDLTDRNSVNTPLGDRHSAGKLISAAKRIDDIDTTSTLNTSSHHLPSAIPNSRRHGFPPSNKSTILPPAVSQSLVTAPSFTTPSPSRIHISTSTDLRSSSVSAVKSLGSFALTADRIAKQSEDDSEDTLSYRPPPLSPSASSVMYPVTYSSGRNKKNYASLTDGRRLGRHLPRIASGDSYPEPRERNIAGTSRRRQEPSEELVIPGISGASDVAGVPGRIRLSRASKANAPAPLPSSRLATGLWADVQRNVLQAYEYLCHVGEAQQWIEGCLKAELGFGVVEMEEGLRNGVVLARLVRALDGESAVKRIYQAPKLDYRHSDNINHFLLYVRRVGLPECFIFETLDLYEKKNFPKVIYSIHALSHLLARRGKAERIGNLLGQLKFSDDQLEQTQKGLEHAGVPLPNFGTVGKELAKEIHEEPDAEVESDEERRDRLLLENESSIVSLQTHARGYLVRRDQSSIHARLRFMEPITLKLQSLCRTRLTRSRLARSRETRERALTSVPSLQAAVRGVLLRRRFSGTTDVLKTVIPYVIAFQAQARGALQRNRISRLKAALKTCKFSVVKIQTSSRARLAKRTHKELTKTLTNPTILNSVTRLQGFARGLLQRRRAQRRYALLKQAIPDVIGLQAHSRGALIRRAMRNRLAKLTDIRELIARIQAASRAYLAGKRLLNLIRGLRKATPHNVKLQSLARGVNMRRKFSVLREALSRVTVVRSVGILQALARATITRNRRREQEKKLEFHVPDIAAFQARCRGAAMRAKHWQRRNHLHSNIETVITLQSLVRGLMQKRKYQAKMAYYRANLQKVVKIQSLVRAKDTREQYQRLTLGKNVNVATIKNFVHLLDDSEADFKEEIEVEKLRERLVKNIRENQALETDVSELDVKIALMVQNAKSFEELIKAKRRLGLDSAAANATRASVLAAHGDPFAGPNTLDRATKRKLELYQQLFYLLQTRADYLARLLFRLSHQDTSEKERRLVERVVLALFGYGQGRREDFLLLKFLQASIHEEVYAMSSPTSLSKGHPLYINLAVQYIRPKQLSYVRDTFQSLIREVVYQEDLDLETDPSILHRNRVNLEEMRSGKVSLVSKDVSFHDAIEKYFPETRVDYIRNLQKLLALTKAFVQATISSTKRMPYGLRYIAHETLVAMRAKYSDESPEQLACGIGRLIYYRFINPAIIAPETYDIVHDTVDPVQRKNLAAIAKVLTQIALGSPFGKDEMSFVPLNDLVEESIGQFATWFIEVADVPQPEVHLDAYEFLDVAVQPKPIVISPNEVYSMHRLLNHNLPFVSPRRDDILRAILQEMDGVPNLGSDELNEARDRAITLELTNRFAEVEDPHAAEKALWVQAKRSVLAILRVQPAKDLVESLMQPVADEHESMWEEIVERDLHAENVRFHQRRQPSVGGAETAYRLEDIQSLSFREVKAHAISCLLKLEKQSKVTRSNGYQGILDAIAGDVRSKHRKRLERQKEMESMHEALAHLAERKKYYLEQINSYNNYVEAAMQTMQRGKGKKRFVMPFTKQYFHLRDLQRSGQSPKFGSFKYSAQDLYDKGILLSIDQFSPRQYDRIDVVMSSDKVGIFTVELHNTSLGGPNMDATTDVRLEDLLQAQFENRVSLALFNGIAKFNVNLLLYQINKKFYV